VEGEDLKRKDDIYHADNWIFGMNPVHEAIMSGQRISALYTCRQASADIKRLLEAVQQSIPVKFVEREFFDRRFQKAHQGIAALVERKTTITLEELINLPVTAKETAFFLVLDLIEDPHNFGALLRVADAAGMHGVIFQKHRSAPVTGVVAKASAGAVAHVNLVKVVNIKHALEKMKQHGITIIGADGSSAHTIWDMDMRVPLSLVVGSEGTGLRRTVRDMCDALIRIPMIGRVDSLNVSVATGVIAYEIVRQRSGIHGQ
jgi:23S rRNA (guanosine2251-2'-O)-methyltransferase